MVFSSPVFLFAFLAVLLPLYYIVPKSARNALLLTASLFFYFWGAGKYTLIMVFSIVINYFSGLIIDYFKKSEKKKSAKITAISAVILNIALLFFFKYWDFIAKSFADIGIGFMPVLNIVLPIGISFYTFQAMSYTVDVYRGDAAVQKSIVRFGTFVSLFPQLIAGPIIKYKDIGSQIDNRSCTYEKFASGIIRFIVGLSKKLLIANNIGLLFETMQATPSGYMTVLGAWLGILAFALQIYFDFSGYSDMAIGLALMLGFEFSENFNYPYIAGSVTDFWRRWHISLTSWFREYLYIPLGGNRCSKPRWIINLLIVWAITGIWHGASWNFLLWGLYFFLILIIEKLFLAKALKAIPSFIGHIYTLFIVLMGWVLFAVEDFGALFTYIKTMFGFAGNSFVNGETVYYLLSYLPLIIVSAVAATPLLKKLFCRLPRKFYGILCIILTALALVACTAYTVAGTYNPFLYFRF